MGSKSSFVDIPVHFDMTDQPTAMWVIQQLREAFGLDAMPRYLIFDRDSIFAAQVVATVKSFGTSTRAANGRAQDRSDL